MSTIHKRTQQTYHHRLRELVRNTGDTTIAASFGVPRSTIRGWLRGDYQPVPSADLFDMDSAHPKIEVLTLRQRNQRLVAVVRLLRALLRALDIRLDQRVFK